MPTAGKQKGNTGERKIAEFLTRTFGAKFMRVPNSGAVLGGKNRVRGDAMDAGQRNLFKSDIIPPTDLPKLVIESKFYKSFPFEKLSGNQPIAQLDKWIQQILATVEPGDVWMLVVRINRKGSWVCFDQQWLAQLQVGNHTRYQTYVWCEFEHLMRTNVHVIRGLCSS